jgi:hypothetical protein
VVVNFNLFNPKPGKWYDDLDPEIYHGGPGVSSTKLKRIVDWSPLHYATAPPLADTPAMQQGRILHTAILEPHELERRYIWAEGIDLRTKAGKAAWADLQEEAAETGAEIVREGPARFLAIADAVTSHPSWRHLMGDQPAKERSYYWQDDATGQLLKARPDALNETSWMSGNRALIVDLKSTTDPRPGPFARKTVDLGYDFSAAMYCEGVSSIIGKPCDFAWFAFQAEPPYEVAVYFMSLDFRRRGEARFRQAVTTLAECEKTGHWPGIAGGQALTLECPSWAKLEAQQEVA